jgi:hypothetical protein
LVIALGGGGLMLVGAAIADNSASIPLVIIGGAWLLMGLLGFRQNRRMASEIQLTGGGLLTFSFPKERISLPVSEVVEIRPSRGDINRFAPILVKDVNGHVVRLVPRLQGLVELLLELRHQNPSIRVGNF